MIGRLGNTATIIKDRFLGFLIWQSCQSTLVYFLCKTLLAPLTPSTTFTAAVFAFLFFQLSLLLFSTSLFMVSSPQPVRGVSPIELLLGLLKLIFVHGGQPLPSDFRRRARVTLSFILFLASSGVSAFVSVVCLSGSQVFGALGLRGLAVGLIYGSHYVFTRRWVLYFPIVQRPLFFSYKMGVRKAIVKAIKLSSAGYLLSLVLPIFIKDQLAFGGLVIEQIVFYFACVVVFLCWELNLHLLQVFLTKRYLFAPPKGSAAAETNPSDHLLAALEVEETSQMPLVRYLAYLDLCMVSESNVDSWRRAAFFEETGETYKKVIAVCLKPLEQLTLDLSEGLGLGTSNSFQLSHQLRSSTELLSTLHEPFYDFQVCAWCAGIASSLTVRSHKEDRFGVAQLSGSNAATVSTLLAALIAVETLMGKKTNLSLQSPNGPANIKWAALSPARRDTTIRGNKKDSPYYSKAYSMADILRTSIYQIVSNFHQQMLTSSKAGLLQKDWIATSAPTRDLLLQKLRMFLEFQAN